MSRSRSLILASASPRRQTLLHAAGYCFTVQPAEIDESIHPPGLAPGELVAFLARCKSKVVADAHPGHVVLAADTLVTLHGTVFGKAADRAEARRMLSRLGGSAHSVLTGVVVACRETGFLQTRVIESTVQMRSLTHAELEAYLDSGEWAGKAGAYGIQDPDPFVTCITGSLTNIVGLPIDETSELLTQAGICRAAKQVASSGGASGPPRRDLQS